MSVEVESNAESWANKQRVRLTAAVRAMGESILRAAQANVPVDTGALKRSGRISVVTINGTNDTASVEVAFGGASVDVPYARIWEVGDPWHLNPHFHGRTRDGRTAPLYYLKNAGDAVVERGIKAYL